MPNVTAPSPPKRPASQHGAMPENLPDAGLRGLDHCASLHSLLLYLLYHNMSLLTMVTRFSEIAKMALSLEAVTSSSSTMGNSLSGQASTSLSDTFS
jgi:hypothetical protein